MAVVGIGLAALVKTSLERTHQDKRAATDNRIFSPVAEEKIICKSIREASLLRH